MQEHLSKFIVFEGLDGSGQSTQVKLLADAFLKQNKNVLITKEPTDKPPIGSLIRQVLKKEIKVEPATLQLLFCADRSEHLAKVILPGLKDGKWVISDRYFFSTIAYGSLDLDFEWLIKLNEQFLKPDIVFLLKVRPEICLARIDKARPQRQFFEEKKKLDKVLKGYETLANRFDNIKIIDGEKPIKKVHQEITKLL